ncbi:MAG: hypothetical protein PVF70_09910 [Anaerolineales bacterium]|jgi:hypothetical protein
MLDTRIILAGLWVAQMLNNLWGDVLRIMAGDVTPGEIEGVQVAQGVWFGLALLMLIPIVMVVLTLTLNYPAIRWANIIVAIVFFFVNVIGLPSYPGAYDKFLIIVGAVFNVVIIWYSWKWVA